MKEYLFAFLLSIEKQQNNFWKMTDYSEVPLIWISTDNRDNIPDIDKIQSFWRYSSKIGFEDSLVTIITSVIKENKYNRITQANNT